jgi:hypothetical protein
MVEHLPSKRKAFSSNSSTALVSPTAPKIIKTNMLYQCHGYNVFFLEILIVFWRFHLSLSVNSFCLFLRQGLTSPSWLKTHDIPVPACWLLQLQVCATVPGVFYSLLCFLGIKFRSLHLLGKCSTTWVTLLVLLLLVCFSIWKTVSWASVGPQSSYLYLLSSWDYSCVATCLAYCDCWWRLFSGIWQSLTVYSCWKAGF